VERKAHKPHFHVTAAIIRSGGKVLITRRPAGTHMGGYWEFPGGKQEKGETLSGCLRRELREELGVGIEKAVSLFAIRHEYADRSITLHVFECTGIQAPPRALEAQEIRWVASEALRKYSFPPPDRRIIRFLEGGAGA